MHNNMNFFDDVACQEDDKFILDFRSSTSSINKTECSGKSTKCSMKLAIPKHQKYIKKKNNKKCEIFRKYIMHSKNKCQMSLRMECITTREFKFYIRI